MRGRSRHFTHSKVMAWVALDRAVKAVEQFGLPGPLKTWREIRRNMIPLVGFLPPDDPRMVGTVKAIERELMRDGLLMRYRTETEVDGLPAGEGAFLPCSFWLVDNYALMGRKEESRELFERLLGLRNDLGLLSEEYDPVSGRLVGNFPQAFSHITLVNSARNLAAAHGPAEDRLRCEAGEACRAA